MSAIWANFNVKIEDGHGEKDCELASKIFDWCKENFDWFAEGCQNEEIYLDENLVSCENMYVEDDSLERKPLAWLKKIFEAFHPVQMRVDIVFDYTNAAGESTVGSVCHKLVTAYVKNKKLVKGESFEFGNYEEFYGDLEFSYLPDDFHGYMLGYDFRENPDSRAKVCLRKDGTIFKEDIELWSYSLSCDEDIETEIVNGSFCMTICDSEIPLLNAAGHPAPCFEKMDVEKTFNGTAYEGCEFLGIQFNKDEDPVPLEFEKDHSGEGLDLSEERLKSIAAEKLDNQNREAKRHVTPELDYDDSGEKYILCAKIPTSELMAALNMVWFIPDVSKNWGEVLSCIHLEYNGDNIRLCGTDGYATLFYDIKVSSDKKESCCANIPVNMWNYLEEHLSGDSVTLKLSEDYIAFEMKNGRCRSMICKNKYPEVINTIMSKPVKYSVVTNREKVLTLVSDKCDQCDIYHNILHYEKGKLFLVSRKDNQIGASIGSVDADLEGKSTFSVWMDADMVKNMLSSISTEQVKFSFTDEGSICYIAPIGSQSARYGLMPLNIMA